MRFRVNVKELKEALSKAMVAIPSGGIIPACSNFLMRAVSGATDQLRVTGSDSNVFVTEGISIHDVAEPNSKAFMVDAKDFASLINNIGSGSILISVDRDSLVMSIHTERGSSYDFDISTTISEYPQPKPGEEKAVLQVNGFEFAEKMSSCSDICANSFNVDMSLHKGEIEICSSHVSYMVKYSKMKAEQFEDGPRIDVVLSKRTAKLVAGVAHRSAVAEIKVLGNNMLSVESGSSRLICSTIDGSNRVEPIRSMITSAEEMPYRIKLSSSSFIERINPVQSVIPSGIEDPSNSSLKIDISPATASANITFSNKQRKRWAEEVVVGTLIGEQASGFHAFVNPDLLKMALKATDEEMFITGVLMGNRHAIKISSSQDKDDHSDELIIAPTIPKNPW